jgi:hypothetical protein
MIGRGETSVRMEGKGPGRSRSEKVELGVEMSKRAARSGTSACVRVGLNLLQNSGRDDNVCPKKQNHGPKAIKKSMSAGKRLEASAAERINEA